MPEGLYPRRMDGAVETLTTIKARGLKTGLISNAGVTSAPTLRAMLEHYELLPLLDVLVFSDEAQAAKPSLKLFEAALTALGIDGADAVFLGDSPLHDVAGARAAGMRAVVIGPKHVDGLDPDARIEDLPSLLSVLTGFDPALSF
jgi:HAD superfamily hydrolase (TIGR01509 family)